PQRREREVGPVRAEERLSERGEAGLEVGLRANDEDVVVERLLQPAERLARLATVEARLPRDRREAARLVELDGRGRRVARAEEDHAEELAEVVAPLRDGDGGARVDEGIGGPSARDERARDAHLDVGVAGVERERIAEPGVRLLEPTEHAERLAEP